jgi:hypothetical protein
MEVQMEPEILAQKFCFPYRPEASIFNAIRTCLGWFGVGMWFFGV